MPEGIIYITRTQQDEPNYYKVGRTTLSSTDQRTRHDQTYISGGIKTIREFKVTDVVAAEKAAHDTLLDAKVSVQHAREIFNLDLDILVGKVKSAITPWLVGENINNENNWILDFLEQTNIDSSDQPFRETTRENTISNITELMLRSISEPKGLSINFRLDQDKEYEELLQDIKIGNYLQNALQNIDHHALVKINNWEQKFKIFMHLSITPIFNPVSADYNRLMHENKNKKLVHGLRGFNINKVLDYWSKNYFNSNPALIIPCFDFLKNQIRGYDSNEQADIYLKSVKFSVLKNAMKYCISNQSIDSNLINTKTNNYITHFLGGHLIMTDYPDVFSHDFIESFMQNNRIRSERNNRDR